MNNTQDANDSGRSVLAALCAAIWMVMGIETLCAQRLGERGSGGNDVEVTIDLKEIGARAKKVLADVIPVIKDAKMSSLVGDLQGVRAKGGEPSTAEIGELLGKVLEKHRELEPKLKGAIEQLDGTVDSLVSARGRLESRRAKRQTGWNGPGTQDKTLDRYRDHLRDLALHAQRSSIPFERQNLERVFDTSYRLYETLKRVRGRVSNSGRIADDQTLQCIARLQTIFTVVSTRLKTTAVVVASDRELVDILLPALEQVGDAKALLTSILGPEGGNPSLLPELDSIETGKFIEWVEQAIERSGDELDELSAKALESGDPKNQSPILDAAGRERAYIEVGARKTESNPTQGGK